MALTRLRALWTGVAGSPAYLNLHFDVDAVDVELANDFMIGLLELLSPYQLPSTTWTTEPIAVFINPATGQPTGSASVTPSSGIGNNSGAMVARAAQMLVRWKTGQFPVGREIVGHTYVPYLYSGAMNASGGVEETTRSDIEDAIGALLGDGALPEPVVWSRTQAASYAVNQAEVWNQWAVLRSRRD